MTLPSLPTRRALQLGAFSMAMLAGGLAWAASGWTRIGETADLTLYVNRQTIEKDDNVRRVWEMQDLKTPDADGVMSRRYINEYDCTYKMHRLGQVSSYAGPKLTGKNLFNVNEMGYWRKIPPNGVFVLTYVAVCIQ